MMAGYGDWRPVTASPAMRLTHLRHQRVSGGGAAALTGSGVVRPMDEISVAVQAVRLYCGSRSPFMRRFLIAPSTGVATSSPSYYSCGVQDA